MSPKKKAKNAHDEHQASEASQRLVDQCEGQHGKPRSRFLGRRDTDEKIERFVQDKLSHVDKILLETAVIDGKTVREKLRADTKDLAPGGRLGAVYVAQLSGELSASTDPFANLQVTDGSSGVRGELLNPLQLAHEPQPPLKKDIEPLLQALKDLESLTQFEIIGLLKGCMEGPTLKKAWAEKAQLGILKFFARTKLHLKYPREWDAARPILDHALTVQFTNLKADGVTMAAFAECNAEVCTMFKARDHGQPTRRLLYSPHWIRVTRAHH
jgi:hypothetical protein